MRLLSFATVVLILLGTRASLPADETADGYRPMFNGKDLTGWVNVNCAPSTFFVQGDEIITTGKPTGYLRTEKQYENFIAEFDWMHVNKKEVGNSGFFVWADPLPAIGTPYTRGIEVQVLVNLHKEGYYTSQGDLFSIWGAHCKPDRPHPHGWERCLPSENRTKGGGEWNHYKVIGKNGVLKLHVNGKEVSGISQCTPRKGYLALESEGAECHFKNLKIKELPSTNPTAAETCKLASDFKNLYTGLDLSGWKGDEATMKDWTPRDWVLHYNGQGGTLQTERSFGNAEFMLDFRFPRKDSNAFKFVIRGEKEDRVKIVLTPDGKGEGTLMGSPMNLAFLSLKMNPAGQWNRIHCTVQGMVMLNVNDKIWNTTMPARGFRKSSGALELRPMGAMDLGNLFVREIKE